MTRWNISEIFFFGVAGQRHDISFQPGVNIITGASGTGKSTLIKAIDYCLGSSKCELPAHVRRRCVAVGVKWTCGDAEIIVGRIIPPVGQRSSTHMFTDSGRNLPLPETVDEFEGATTVGAAKAFLERAFGIGDLPGGPDALGNTPGRATIRHVTPYIFVTKEVICSETVLLHGLERPEKARDIVAAMPYFLRVTDEASAIEEQRLRQKQRALDKEEARERSRATAFSVLKEQAINLLGEAHRIGLAPRPSVDWAEDELLARLRRVSNAQLEANTYPNESELGALHTRRRKILSELSVVRRESQATRTAIQEATGFESAVTRQREKLMLAEHLQLHDVSTICPVCANPSEKGREMARTLQSVLSKVREESAAIERVKPKLTEHGWVIEEVIEKLNTDLHEVDDQIKAWLSQSQETKRLADLAQLRAHLLGRISFFLESSADEPRQQAVDLDVLRAEIAELEARVDREAKEIKLRHAEGKISNFASEAMSALPTVAPCVGSEIQFSARQPAVTIIEADSGAVLRMPDVGSDQNYLAVHISLSFALQHYFEISRSPVPGLLVFDQISRPYFPTSGDDDETEIDGQSEDEDVLAMRKHIDFLFAEAERRNGLQVLLIEHAYFADDPRYVAATRERWTRASGRALIPSDWAMRSDVI